MIVSSIENNYRIIRNKYSSENSQQKKYSDFGNELKNALINTIVDFIVDKNDESKTEKPGKGFYFSVDTFPAQQIFKKFKSTLTPFQERINRTYNVGLKKDTGIIVDMTV